MPFGTTCLVRRQRDQVGRCCRLAHVEPTECLRRVGVQQRVRRHRANDLGNRAQVLHNSCLVVDQVHRHHRHVVDRTQAVRKRVEIDETLLVHANKDTAQVLDRVQHRVVLSRRAHGNAAVGADRTTNGHVVGLGAATREHDLAWLGTNDRGEALARIVERGARITRHRVRARRVAEALGQQRHHRLHGRRPHRRGGGVVEVVHARSHHLGAGPQPGCGCGTGGPHAACGWGATRPWRRW